MSSRPWLRLLLLTLLACSWARPAAASLLQERTPCVMLAGSYADYQQRAVQQWQNDAAAALKAQRALRPQTELAAALWPADEYARRSAYVGFTCERLVYLSDGFKVVAFLWKPASAPAAGRLPLIVFNRGGLGEAFKLRPNTWFGFYSYVAAGYAVLATQYRGNDGGEGEESPGSGDIHDVLNLLPLAAELALFDRERVFMLGFSRGGYVTLRALQDGAGAKVRAAAVVGATRSLSQAAATAPTITSGVPVPLLVLHGGADGSVPSTEAVDIARSQWAAGQPGELVVYDGDSHGLTFNQRDRDARVLAWFARFTPP